MKKCNECKQEKPESDFYRRVASKDGLMACCKACVNFYNLHWRKINPKKAMQSIRRGKLKDKYGLSEIDFAQLSKAQDGKCAICGREERRRGHLSIDHCHLTNEIRGLLCHMCNSALGFFQDSPLLLRKAADYIEKHAKQKSNNQTKV